MRRCVMCLYAAGLALVSHVSLAAELARERLTVEIATKLGETDRISAAWTSIAATRKGDRENDIAPYGDEISALLVDLDGGESILRNVAIRLRTGDTAPRRTDHPTPGIYALIPWGCIREIKATKAGHDVVLKAGNTYTGELFTAIRATDGREYPLRSCRHVTVSEAILPPNPAPAPPSTPQFSLSLARGTAALGPLSFVERVVVTHGALSPGGRDTRHFASISFRGPTFKLIVDGEQISGNVPSFESISFEPAKKIGDWTVSVKAPNAETVTGTLMALTVTPMVSQTWAMVYRSGDGSTIVAVQPPERIELKRTKD